MAIFNILIIIPSNDVINPNKHSGTQTVFSCPEQL